MKLIFQLAAFLTTITYLSGIAASFEDRIEIGSQFRSQESPHIYLECTNVIQVPHGPENGTEAGWLKRMFHIKAREDLNVGSLSAKKDEKLGWVQVSLHDACVDIPFLEIDKPFQGKKVDTQALLTILEIYNAEERSTLPFDHFCLTTTTHNRTDLECYTGCGFQAQARKGHPTPPGWVYLFREREGKR